MANPSLVILIVLDVVLYLACRLMRFAAMAYKAVRKIAIGMAIALRLLEILDLIMLIPVLIFAVILDSLIAAMASRPKGLLARLVIRWVM